MSADERFSVLKFLASTHHRHEGLTPSSSPFDYRMISAPPVPIATLPEAACAIARRLGEVLRPDAIFLFGSHARGDAGPDSDLDFLVVVPDSLRSRYMRSVDVRALVADIPAPKDIVVLTRREWESEQRVLCSLASTVRREGIQLHG